MHIRPHFGIYGRQDTLATKVYIRTRGYGEDSGRATDSFFRNKHMNQQIKNPKTPNTRCSEPEINDTFLEVKPLVKSDENVKCQISPQTHTYYLPM